MEHRHPLSRLDAGEDSVSLLSSETLKAMLAYGLQADECLAELSIRRIRTVAALEALAGFGRQELPVQAPAFDQVFSQASAREPALPAV